MNIYDEDGNFTAAHRREIARRLDQAIRLSRKTRAAVAGELGVSRAAVTQYCDTGSIALDKLARFCQFTKASMDYIVFGETPDIEASVMPAILAALEKRREGVLATEDQSKTRGRKT